MNVAEAERRVEVVADADGADDVDGEERNPAEQKHSCGQILWRPQIMNELLRDTCLRRVRFSDAYVVERLS